MNENSLFYLFKKERETFERYKKSYPRFFVPLEVPEKDIFSEIGIDFPIPPRQKGYLRLYPQDFIVEEISIDDKVSEIEPKENKDSPDSPVFTLYANLVKVQIATFEAISILAKYLEIKPEKIGQGGLKDIGAITSQKVAFPNINLEVLEKIKKFSHSNFYLTDFSFGKGSIAPGKIFGNRFTIFIRAEEKIDKEKIKENLKKIEENGVLNFYQAQRFGTPRFLSHILGKLILQEEYKKAVFIFLFNSGLKGIPFIQKVREKAEKLAPNWKKVEEIFEKFPYTFRNELRLLSYLKKYPENFIGALFFFKDQTTLWVYAYTSYLFNLLISLDKKLDLPEEIPLLSSNDPKDWEIYNFWLEKDEIKNFQKAIEPFRFLILKRRFVKTRVFPKKIQFKILPEGLILSFILEKGSYATTLLMNLFEIETGESLPVWVKTKEYDIKKELKIGSVEKAKKVLGKDIFTLQKQKNEDEIGL
jgi:TruD family tRNA pseudouridine synthase